MLVSGSTGGNGAHFDELKRLIEEMGGRALVVPHPSFTYIDAVYAFGFEQAMQAMLEDPDLFFYTSEKLRSKERDLMLQYAKAGVEAVFCTDSWSSADVISPAMFERFALPYQRSLVEAANDAGLKIMLWNLDDIGPILRQKDSLAVNSFGCE